MSRPRNTPEQQEAAWKPELEQQRKRRAATRIKEGAGRPRMTPEQQEASRLRKKDYDRRRRQGQRTTNSIHGGRVHAFHVPEHVLIERDRRSNMPTTPNIDILGDPVEPRWMSNSTSEREYSTVGYICRFY